MRLNPDLPFDKNDTDSIVEACKNGNEYAKTVLMDKYYGEGKSVVHRYIQNKEDAEEILEDSFAKIFRNLEKYKMDGTFEFWLRRLIITTASDHNRKKSKFEFVSIDDVEIVNHDNDLIMGKLSMEELLKLVDQLSPTYKQVFNMIAIDRLTHKEVAEVLKITKGTSKSNFYAARINMQLLIKKEYPELYEAQNFKNNLSHDE